MTTGAKFVCIYHDWTMTYIYLGAFSCTEVFMYQANDIYERTSIASRKSATCLALIFDNIGFVSETA